MPPELAAELRAIGARIEPQKTGELYAPLQPKEPCSWLSVTREQKYGPHERNVLDVFAAPDPGRGKPVVVFVHGGGFVRGAKRIEGSPFYDNIGVWAVGVGLVGVTINYRLAPESTWPSGVEDLTAVVPWLEANVARFGGDPAKIVLWGHSAGAAHVADYVASAAKRGVDAGVAGAVLTSGFYDLGSEVSVWKIYYGDDVGTYAERSSLPGLVATTVPLFVNDAELDPLCSKRKQRSSLRPAELRASRSSTCTSKVTRTSRRPMWLARAIDRCRCPCSSSCAARARA